MSTDEGQGGGGSSEQPKEKDRSWEKPADREEREGGIGKAAELMKKFLTVGVGAAFMTEESLRGMVSDLKLPKEIIGNLLATGQAAKAEFFSKLSTDLIERVQAKVDPAALMSEILQKNEIEFTIKMTVKPKKPPSGSEA